MWNFPYFESYIKEVMKVDIKKVLADRENEEYDYTHPVTGEKMIGQKIIRWQNYWVEDYLGYFAKIRFDFFETSEKDTLGYLDILGITKNYFRYYGEYAYQRLESNIPYLMGVLENLTKEELLILKEEDYDRWLKLRNEAETRTREILRYKALAGHDQDQEVDLVLKWFYDEVTNYIEAVPEKPRLRRDTPMMFWKRNIYVFPDLDERFQAKIQKWLPEPVDENFFPRQTAEEIARIEADRKKRQERVAEALAEDVADDLSTREYFREYKEQFRLE